MELPALDRRRLRAQTTKEAAVEVLPIPGQMHPAESTRVDELEPVSLSVRLDRPDQMPMGRGRSSPIGVGQIEAA
jgi:hypothetical protein